MLSSTGWGVALLPLAGWADDVVVKPYNMTKIYGTADAAADLVYTVTGLDTGDEDALAGLLKVKRTGSNASENVGEWSYTFQNINVADVPSGTFTGTYSRILIDGSATLTIEPLDISSSSTIAISGLPSGANAWTYDGTTRALPSFTVKETVSGEEVTLVKDTDYEVKTYTELVNAGAKAITITGKGNYTGDKAFTDAFTISAKSIASNDITVTGLDSKNAQGTDYASTVIAGIKVYDTAISSTEALTSDSYTAAFSESEVKDPGKYTVTITGAGNYEGSTKTLDFYVLGSKSLSNAEIALTDPTATFTYDGSNQTPALTVTVDGETLTADTDYEVSWANNKDAGTATATITGLGAYANPDVTKTLQITINKAKLVVSVSDASKTYGQADSEISVTPTITSGNVGSESPSVKLKIATHAEDYAEEGYADVLQAEMKNATGVNKNYEIDTENSTWGKLTINKKSIAGLTYGFNVENKVYDGEAPVFDFAGNITDGETALAAADYTVKYKNTVTNVETETAPAGVGTYQLIFSGAGNYNASKSFNYSITKADLYITPDANQGKSVSVAADPTLTWHLEGLVSADADKTVAQILGTQAPVLNRAAGNDAGQKLISVQSNSEGIAITSSSTPITADNYFVKPNPTNVYFTISQNSLEIAVNAQTILYGDAFPVSTTLSENVAKVTPQGLIAGDALTEITLKVYATDENGAKTGEAIAAATAAQTPGTYYLEASAPTFSTSGENYAVNIINSTLTINPFKIRIKAVDNNVTSTTVEALTTDLATADNLDTNVSLVKVTVVDATETETALTSAANLPFAETTATTPWIAEFVESLTWEKNEGQSDYTFGQPGFIKVNLKEGLSTTYPYYTFETVNGTVTFTDAEAGALVLDRTKTGDESVSAILSEYNGGTNDIKIQDGRTMNANQWYTMVLPFKTTVPEISGKFGYAVVDIPDVDNTDNGVVKFKLHVGEVPANEVFLIKLAAAKTLDATGAVTFTMGDITGRTIDYDPTHKVTDSGNNEYIGVYESKLLNEDAQWYLSGGEYWNAGPAANNVTVQPLSGYINAVAGSNARIFVEETDGSVTAINAITGEQKTYSKDGWYTINGVKLNGVPTEKGVYIQNGKKIVVK